MVQYQSRQSIYVRFWGFCIVRTLIVIAVYPQYEDGDYDSIYHNFLGICSRCRK